MQSPFPLRYVKPSIRHLRVRNHASIFVSLNCTFQLIFAGLWLLYEISTLAPCGDHAICCSAAREGADAVE